MGRGFGFTTQELAVKLPLPPDTTTLRAVLRPEDLVTYPSGTELWHIYKRGGAHPVHWNQFRYYGPVDARFDHHTRPRRTQSRGILYLATLISTCVAEVFQADHTIELARDQPWLVAHAATRRLTLLNLTGAWPTRAGASMLINDGPRVRSRLWSAAIYDAYPQVDGLLYSSSMHRQAPCLALYERGRDTLPVQPSFNRPLTDPALFDILAAIADDLGYALS